MLSIQSESVDVFLVGRQPEYVKGNRSCRSGSHFDQFFVIFVQLNVIAD